MTNFIKTVILASFVLFIFSCKNASEHDHDGHDDHEHDHSTETIETEAPEEEERAHLQASQIEAIGLETGTFTPLKMAGYFKANGIIDLPPQSVATLSAPETGFVKEVRKNYVVGSYVKKGTVLTTLEHPMYIQKQQEYLESVSELLWLEQELQRQKTLNEANANALKAFQKAQADFNVMTARKKGLEQYLNYLGIDVERLNTGEISQVINLKAPLSGYISEVNINKGMLVEAGRKLYEIANNDHVHLELQVFEKDISKLQDGLKVSYSIPSLGSEQFEAEVHEIGRAFDADNKSILVHCHVEGKQPKFIRGLYAEAKIWLDEQTVNALPEEAIIRSDGAEYIFIQEAIEDNGEVVFKPILVRTGKKEDEFLEVMPIDLLEEDAKIVIKGAYYLMAEMKKGEGGHSH